MKRRRVLITGAANGIGLALTKRLAEEGFEVIATDIDENSLKNIKELTNVTIFKMDVTSEDSIREVLTNLQDCEINQLDVLINNAGVFIGGPLVEIEPADFERLIKVNILGTFLVTKYFFPLLLPTQGIIVNMSSEAARFSFPFNGPYSITKFATEAFSDALRRELKLLGIKVVKIQPGAIRTALLEGAEKEYESLINRSQFFKKQLMIALKFLKEDIRKGAEPEFVAKKILQIINKRHIKPTYRIKNNKMRRILEFLPEALSDKLITIFMKK